MHGTFSAFSNLTCKPLAEYAPPYVEYGYFFVSRFQYFPFQSPPSKNLPRIASGGELSRNAFIHDMETQIALGDTMNRPAFTNTDGSLQKFDIVTAKPMWNQDFSQGTYENDPIPVFLLAIRHRTVLTGAGSSTCMLR